MRLAALERSPGLMAGSFFLVSVSAGPTAVEPQVTRLKAESIEGKEALVQIRAVAVGSGHDLVLTITRAHFQRMAGQATS
jgi:hypothetical protein